MIGIRYCIYSETSTCQWDYICKQIPHCFGIVKTDRELRSAVNETDKSIQMG